MSWQNLFREFEMERRQKEEEEKKKIEEEKRKRMEMVHKFHGRVEEVIKEFSKATGREELLKESGYHTGFWHTAYPSESKYAFDVKINPGSIKIYCKSIDPRDAGILFPMRDYSEDIPLSTFTEEALAEALLRTYRRIYRWTQ